MSQPTPPPPPHPYMPHPYVMMPVVERNGLGVFGFLVSLVGLVIPTGIVSFVGLMISLVALGRRPRGLASTGVVLGLIGTVAWVVIGVVALIVGVIGAVAVLVVGSLAFMLVQPEVVEVTSDMLNVTIAAKHHEETRRAPATSLEELDLSVSTMTDPWGNKYVLEPADREPGFDLISAGQDGRYGTPDDIALSRLDRLWEQAFVDFEEKMEQLGEKMESLDGHSLAIQMDGCGSSRPTGHRYYRKAVQQAVDRHR